MADTPLWQQRDAYGDRMREKGGSWHWNWRNDHIMRWINNFVRISKANVMANYKRQGIGDYHARQKKPTEHKLKRSLAWKTWATSGGDEQVFRAQYIYYAKFVELALGKRNHYNGPVPEIQAPRWKPITVPTRSRKAKPHIVTEMRRQANRFRVYATEYFQFTGLVTMIYAMGGDDDPAIRAAVNRTLFWHSTRGGFQR